MSALLSGEDRPLAACPMRRRRRARASNGRNNDGGRRGVAVAACRTSRQAAQPRQHVLTSSARHAGGRPTRVMAGEDSRWTAMPAQQCALSVGRRGLLRPPPHRASALPIGSIMPSGCASVLMTYFSSGTG